VVADPSTAAAASRAASARPRAADDGLRYEPLDGGAQTAPDDNSGLTERARATLGMDSGATAFIAACRVVAPQKSEAIGLRVTYHAAEGVEAAAGGADELYARVLAAHDAKSGEIRGRAIAVSAEDARRQAGNAAELLPSLKAAALIVDEVVVAVGGGMNGRPVAFSRISSPRCRPSTSPETFGSRPRAGVTCYGDRPAALN
jgi:hypothetical protein